MAVHEELHKEEITTRDGKEIKLKYYLTRVCGRGWTIKPPKFKGFRLTGLRILNHERLKYELSRNGVLIDRGFLCTARVTDLAIYSYFSGQDRPVLRIKDGGQVGITFFFNEDPWI